MGRSRGSRFIKRIADEAYTEKLANLDPKFVAAAVALEPPVLNALFEISNHVNLQESATLILKILELDIECIANLHDLSLYLGTDVHGKFDEHKAKSARDSFVIKHIMES
jgi:hypothetical protein